MILRDGKETITIILDRERHARLEWMDIIDLEKLPDLKGEELAGYLDQLVIVDSIERDDQGEVKSIRARANSPRAITALLFGAVRWEDSTLTFRQFGQIMGDAIKAGTITVLDCAWFARQAWALGFVAPKEPDSKNAEAEATAH